MTSGTESEVTPAERDMYVGEWSVPEGGFEWDRGNSGKNLRKHAVTDSEAEQVFFNQPLVAALDEKHSSGEDRIHVLGRTDPGRRLFVVCTCRGDLIRVVSARPMRPPPTMSTSYSGSGIRQPPSSRFASPLTVPAKDEGLCALSPALS